VQNHEGGLPGQFGHDLHGGFELFSSPADELAGVAAVGPDQPDSREAGV
jgi:hypothetical protein